MNQGFTKKRKSAHAICLEVRQFMALPLLMSGSGGKYRSKLLRVGTPRVDSLNRWCLDAFRSPHVRSWAVAMLVFFSEDNVLALQV